MCKCFFLFIVFAFIQIQLRWQRDENYQWFISLKGTGACPVKFTHSFVLGHPPAKIHSNHVEFFQDHQLFVYTTGDAYIDGKIIDIHAFVKKGSMLTVDANESIRIDILSGIPKHPKYHYISD